jgi:hypothetical protein
VQAAQLTVHDFAASFYESYRIYALNTPHSWLEMADGAAVRQVCDEKLLIGFGGAVTLTMRIWPSFHPLTVHREVEGV